MIRFAILAAIYITMAVYAFYLNQMLQIRWRRWITDVYLKRWLAERTYYRMQLTGASADTRPADRRGFQVVRDETSASRSGSSTPWFAGFLRRHSLGLSAVGDSL